MSTGVNPNTSDPAKISAIKALRGMYDLLPDETPLWDYLEHKVRSLFKQYAYQEIRTPIAEKTELFCRSIGMATDVVEKEMYTFSDRNNDSISLRPEGTAACVRAALEHGLLRHQTQRLWYYGPMFRYERPQKGRQRQFHQFGAEAYGLPGPDIDAELIIMTARLWQSLGIEHTLTLQLNTLANSASRAAYRTDLVDYLQQHYADLDVDSQRRLTTNPLRILDSKVATTQTLLEQAPDFANYIDAESADHFAQLQEYLHAAQISFEINPHLVRGLDYYCKTVFEWVTDHLGAQGTVCGGGRYDGLIAQMGGTNVAGVGWAMGVERLILLLRQAADLPAVLQTQADIYVAYQGEQARVYSLQLVENLRSTLPESRTQWHCGDGGLKSQLKKADKSGAHLAIIIGEQELTAGQVQIKPLRGQGSASLVAPDQVLDTIEKLLV